MLRALVVKTAEVGFVLRSGKPYREARGNAATGGFSISIMPASLRATARHEGVCGGILLSDYWRRYGTDHSGKNI
ncbi:MAG: hypothetical protein LBT01_03820 [Spirochaetaceae bacterium]|nr:hypothetical protein [Spirochaetaceae bacterium]